MTFWQILWNILCLTSYTINGSTGGSFKEMLCIRLYRGWVSEQDIQKAFIYACLIAFIDFWAFKPKHCKRMWEEQTNNAGD